MSYNPPSQSSLPLPPTPAFNQSINNNLTLTSKMAVGKVPLWEGPSSYISIPVRVQIETYLASCYQQL